MLSQYLALYRIRNIVSFLYWAKKKEEKKEVKSTFLNWSDGVDDSNLNNHNSEKWITILIDD